MVRSFHVLGMFTLVIALPVDAQFQILVDVAEEVLGVGVSPLSEYRKEQNAFKVLSTFLDMCILGNWVGLGLQMFAGPQKMREYGMFVPTTNTVQEIESLRLPTKRYVEVVTESHAPNIIASAFNHMSHLIELTTDAVKQVVDFNYASTKPLLTTMDFFSSPTTTSMPIILNVEGLHPTLTTDDLFNKALSNVCNMTRAAFEVLSQIEAEKCITKLVYQGEK